MSKLFSYISKILLNPIFLGVLFVVSILGGGLGTALDLGFLSAPFAYISIPSETLYYFKGKGFLYEFLNKALTNTLLMSLLSILILTLISRRATKNMKVVPSGLQNLIEFALEAMYNTCKKIAGDDKGKVFFPLVMTIFLFVVISNWIGVLPGTGTIGRIETAEEYCHHQKEKNNLGHDVKFNIYKTNGVFASTMFGYGKTDYSIKSSDKSLFSDSYSKSDSLQSKDSNSKSDSGHGHDSHSGSIVCSHHWLEHDFAHAKEIKAKELGVVNFDDNFKVGILVPFFRGTNSDMNTTLALALIAMACIHWWGFKYLGLTGHAGKFINFKNGPINFFVGILELVGEFAKVISFTFRLFGNIFAGEVLLFAMAFLLPLIGIIPFIGLELFVGLIQGLIFSMLTLVFAAIATVSHNSDEH